MTNDIWEPTFQNALSTTPKLLNGATTHLAGWYLHNPSNATAYVQFFDALTTSAVTLGSTTPTLSFGIPAGSSANLNTTSIVFNSGVVVAATTTATGSSAPSTALECNFWYK